MFCGLIVMALGAERGAEEPSDEALVTAAQRGSAEAFARLHGRYYARVYRLAYLKLGNASDAEDVAGETFLRALAHLPRFRFASLPSGRRSLYPWLHRIALNLIADSGRQRPPMGTVSLDEPTVRGLRALLTSCDAGPTPQEIVERREVQQMVRDAIAALPADQGEVLIYRFLGELSLREVAPLMRRSEAAAKSLLHRAVVALRAELERRLVVENSAVASPSRARKEARPDVGETVLVGRRGG
ncbi:MAG: sigma-70 family RNA polymerase sigma factor [Armatimonadetes bacterium]|nr:sigma-70 family RNA polymerase sigma factor [Armatimonadota bacterium]